jgi:hypothetical protein
MIASPLLARHPTPVAKDVIEDFFGLMAQPFAFFAKAGAFQPSQNKIPALSLQKPERQGQGALVE